MTTKLFICATFLLLTPMLKAESEKPKVQIALLLDASGSMNGLIHQAQAKLWSMVNHLATAKKGDKRPTFEVALYMYGHSQLPASEGYIRCLQPLTQDLDAVSEALFEITTNGGDEFCGQAIATANTLNWSTNPNDYKAIFIAGNEPFSQGSVDFRKACKDTIAKGIVVNTIFCGNKAEGIKTGWQEGALLADGQFMVLDHQAAMVSVRAPQDKAILTLGDQLNQTYLAYGSKGKASEKRMRTQDKKVKALAVEASVSRTVAKASWVYDGVEWDMVSAFEEDASVVEDIPAEQLPEALKNKDQKQRVAFLEAQVEKRKEIKAKIADLEKARKLFLANQVGKNNQLDDLMVKAISQQLMAKKFQFTQQP